LLQKDITCLGNNALGEITATVGGGFAPYDLMWNNNAAINTLMIDDLEAGVYTLQVRDSLGCVVQDTASVVAAPCCTVYVPNAFSPNGDGTNDEFKVITNATIADVTFAVYDRWGNRVFITNDEKQGWNGKMKGINNDLDTYFYLFSYFCPYANKTYRITGDVILVR
jgi:gliding motility-associated-like protein